MTSIFISTKNRPMQLAGCLDSIEKFLLPYNQDIAIDLYILYKECEPYSANYEKVFDSIKLPYVIVDEVDFRTDFLETLEDISCNNSILVGMTDDSYFYRPVTDFKLHEIFEQFEHWNSLFSFSLRLGTNTTIQNPCTKSLMTPLENIQEGLIGKFPFWDYQQGPLCYNWFYPISLDGGIYRSAELFELSKNIKFDSLRSWESNLVQKMNKHSRNWMACANKSSVVNCPANAVQPDAPETGPFSMSVERLNELFSQGKRMDLDKMFDDPSKIDGSHVFRPLRFNNGVAI